MRGIIFTSFLEKLEQDFGYEFVDEIITKSNLQTGGVYTSVGNYDFGEMVSMLVQVSVKLNVSIDDLLHGFGKHFFYILIEGHKNYIKTDMPVLEFLASIQNHIHVEVRKLYPDAELPEFNSTFITPKQLQMVYSSKKKLHHFAKGLMESALDYFKTTGTVAITNIDDDAATFLIAID